MYGTVAHMKVKPGQVDALTALSQESVNQRRPKGYLGEYVYQLDRDTNEVVLVVLFQDKESYVANANDPEQDKEYRRFRDLLEADPVWHDGEIIHSSMS
jgi:quinol monooxygenase YgiN